MEVKKDLMVTVVNVDDTYSFNAKGLINSSSYYSDKEVLFINGEQAEIPYNNIISLKEPITKIQVFKIVTYDSHVQNLNKEEVADITVEEYHHKLKQLESKMSNSLEDEFEYRKFKRDYQIVQKKVLTLMQKLPFKAVDMTDPKIPYVTLNRHLGKPVTDCTATFDQQAFLLNYIRTYLKAKGWSDKEDKAKGNKNIYSLYHYNEGMVNLYLEGSQIFDVRKYKHSDTLANVIREKDSLEMWVKNKLDTYFENIREGISQNDVNDIMRRLLKHAEKIDSKMGTRHELMNLIREIKANIKE